MVLNMEGGSAAPIKSATPADWDDEFTYCGISGGTGNYSYSGVPL